MRFIIVLIGMFLLSFQGNGQTLELARNYYVQGEYAKAESVYQTLYQKHNNSYTYLRGLVSSLQEQQKYKQAEKLLKAFDERRHYPGLNVEIGHNFQLQKQTEHANLYYEKAIARIDEQPNYAYMIGRTFEKYGLLEQAIKAYKKALAKKPNATYAIALASVYGQQAKFKEMFSTFLDLIEQDEKYYGTINRYFTQYITPDPQNETNQILRNLLLKRIQEKPLTLYNKLLSWLYVQESQFKNAFIQQKAIYRRSEHKSLSGILRLAHIAADKNAYTEAMSMLDFAVDNSKTAGQKITAYNQLMGIELAHAKPDGYGKIDKQFKTIFDQFGKGLNTLPLQLQYAQFLAFKQQKTLEGKAVLDKLLETQTPNQFQEARIKMAHRDILVAEGNFNQALIYYSQIKYLVKNSPLAQKAAFKVAKTSYYKGDFDWALTQLKVLKESTSDLISNNAIALSLLIESNKGKDSVQTGLKLYAKADLFAAQGKNEEALAVLDTVLTRFKGKSIEAPALFKSAKLYEKLDDYKKAENAYQNIITFHANGSLVDDAYFHLAELYRTKLNDPEKAKENYLEIIFHHADSIFYVEARKAFRELRGDAVQ